ncbi:MAG: hypothetical protein KDC83_14125 [Flavobacteriales bacterium]|nr:hypothetical protein [Flavobacteriales bacterium]
MKKLILIGSLFLFSNCLSASAKANTETVKPSKNDSATVIEPDTNTTVVFPNPFLFLTPANTGKKK